MVVVQLTVLSQDIQVCRKCGIVFNLNIRENKDCPLCGAGEHTETLQATTVPFLPVIFSLNSNNSAGYYNINNRG
jgi:hypothetical protein